MITETKAATPETGTPTLKQETTTAEQGKVKTTSQNLFQDLKGRNIPGADLFEPKPEPAKPAVEPPKEVKAEPKPETKPGPKYLAPEDFADAVVKLKVDGIEEEAKFQDVIRRVQLDKHLTLKGQKLSDEERRIKEKEIALSEREKVLMEMAALQTNQTKDKAEEESAVKDDPYVKRIEDQLKQTQDMMKQLAAQTAPMVLQSSLARVDNYVKETFGQTDFLVYQDKIRDQLIAMPPDQARGLDNEAGWLSVYKDIKLRELMEAAKTPAKPETPPPAERPAPKIVPVESAQSASTAINDDDSAKYRVLIDRAKKLTQENSPERHKAWEDVLGFKRRET